MTRIAANEERRGIGVSDSRLTASLFVGGASLPRVFGLECGGTTPPFFGPRIARISTKEEMRGIRVSDSRLRAES